MKLCIYCNNLYWDGGSPGYSEWTPGSNWSCSCVHEKIELDFYPTIKEFQSFIEQAGNCEFYDDGNNK